MCAGRKLCSVRASEITTTMNICVPVTISEFTDDGGDARVKF
jgi:hypothetical protein